LKSQPSQIWSLALMHVSLSMVAVEKMAIVGVEAAVEAPLSCLQVKPLCCVVWSWLLVEMVGMVLVLDPVAVEVDRVVASLFMVNPLQCLLLPTANFIPGKAMCLWLVDVVGGMRLI
jgi:hypothetical protein